LPPAPFASENHAIQFFTFGLICFPHPPARVKRRMQWEAPSKLLAVNDPLLLPEREVHVEIGKNGF